MRLVKDKLVDIPPLLSRSYSLDRWAEAFAAVRRSEGVKMVLVPDSQSETSATAASNQNT